MARWIVIPVKAPGLCKTRLRSVLPDEERQALVAAMLRHVVAVARGMEDAKILLLGPSRHGLPETIPLLPDPGPGLNEALATAIPAASAAGVSQVAFLAADLPRLARPDLEMLLGVPANTVAIAPDRWDRGTNALCLPMPLDREFRLHFGPDSFARHQEEAQRLSLIARVIRSPGLGFDVDTPEDLAILPRQAG